MRKTIELTKEDVDTVIEYQQRNGLKNFSEAVRYLVRNYENLECKCGGEEKGELGKYVELLVEINKKIDLMLPNIAPKSAGEVN